MNADAEFTGLVDRAIEEVLQAEASGWKIEFQLDLSSALQLIGNLQLALRHPENVGPAADLARKFIDMVRDGLRDRGYTAHLEMLRLGDDPANDRKTLA